MIGDEKANRNPRLRIFRIMRPSGTNPRTRRPTT
jgi:hypothetical protein